MRMNAKTHGIKILIVSHLQLKMFSRKQLVTKNFILYVLVFIFILKSI